MAEVIRFVNSASTPGGDGTTNNTTGATRAYAALVEWEAAEQTDLVSAGDFHHLKCSGSGTTENVFVTGWTTSSTNFIWMEVDSASRHTGTTGTGFSITSTGGSGRCIANSQAGTIIDGFELIVPATNANRAINLDTASDVLVINNIVCGTSGNTNSDGIVIIGSVTGSVGIINNVIFGFSDDGFWCANGTQPTLLNNTSCNNGGDGFQRALTSGTLPLLQNNVAFGNGGSDYNGSFNASSSHNADEDGTAPGSSSVTGVATGDFTDEANGDFSIDDNTSALYNVGTDLSSAFSGFDRSTDFIVADEDIIGTSRPQSTTWDISAFELIVAVGGWTGIINGVTNPAKINGILVANIAKVNGVVST